MRATVVRGSLRLLSLVLLLAAASLTAQEAAQPAQSDPYDRGWHIVRPGENLHQITGKYLGDPTLWRENWRLNPSIQNPDRLSPGQRIEVLIERQQSVPTARLRSVAGPVEERPAPIPWNPAREQDLLLEEDGLRTGSKGSTEMEFHDGTRVTMTEESLVFLRRAGRRLTGVPPRSVEIVEGQADVAARRPPGTSTEVEILVGGTLARPQLDEAGLSQTRARRPDGGGAKVMVYEGGGEVEAAGTSVSVGRGMGTSVEEGRAPSPPEKLLSAAVGLSPQAGARLDFNNIDYSWEPVPGAVSYTHELCRDPGCVQLVDRAVGLVAPGLDRRLARGEYFWRVTAVSASGLDGYPSAGAALAVLADGPDLTPPTGRLAVVGRQLSLEEVLFVDERVKVEPSLEDTQSGVEGWRPIIDGAETSRARWDGPWPDGRYAATVVAVDRAGNEGRIPAVAFVVDALPPELTADGSAPSAAREGGSRSWQRERSRWLREGHRWIEASVDGVRWLPLVAADSRLARQLDRRHQPWRDLASPLVVRSDHPQLMIRSADGRPLNLPVPGSAPVPVVRLWAVDGGVGVFELELALAPGEDGEWNAEVAAVDAFGHRRSLAWQLLVP